MKFRNGDEYNVNWKKNFINGYGIMKYKNEIFMKLIGNII